VKFLSYTRLRAAGAANGGPDRASAVPGAAPVAPSATAAARRPTRTPDHRPQAVGIRRVTEADLPELARLDRAVFGANAYPDFVVRQLFDVHGHHLLALDTPAGLRGYVLLATARGRDTGWILGLGVEEPWRRLGYGRQLLARCLRDLVEPGLREIRLTVEPGNAAAVQLYRSLGFLPAGGHPDYLGPGEDRLIMRLPLGGAGARRDPGPGRGEVRGRASGGSRKAGG
jgi:[ribosomal protein S18]-alanine N-acetyltransferase